MSSAGNCSNRSAERPACGDSALSFSFVKVALLGSVFAVAAVGNALLLCALWRKRRRNTRSQMFLLHLSLADLLLALCQVLPQLSVEISRRSWGSELACRAVRYLQVVGMFSCTYTTVAMSVDRYHAACRPAVSFFRGSCRRYMALGAAWTLSFAFSSPQLFAGQPAPHCWATFVEPWGDRGNVTWLAVSAFVLPVAVLLFCQVRMCRGIYWTRRRRALQSAGGDARTGGRGASSATLKTVKMTGALVALYAVCWGPFFALQLWTAWSPASAPADVRQTCNGGGCCVSASFFAHKWSTFGIIMLLASLNSCTNPWIYLYYS
ncbi:vasopressin V2 receptor-like [Arapaima gigas]